VSHYLDPDLVFDRSCTALVAGIIIIIDTIFFVTTIDLTTITTIMIIITILITITICRWMCWWTAIAPRSLAVSAPSRNGASL
jgi:hypothetical protein